MNWLFRNNRVVGWLLGLAGLLAAPRPAAAQAWQQALSSLTAPGTSGTCLAVASASDTDGNVFVVGYFAGTVQFGATPLVSVNQYTDMFVAKWAAATQQWAWATSGGGSYNDVASGVAVRGHEVLVTGNFTSNTNTPVTAVIAGTSLPGAGDIDVFLASYQDQGSTYAPNWAVSDGGSGGDTASGGLALAGNNLYVAGTYDRGGHAHFAGTSLGTSPSNDYRAYLAKYALASAGQRRPARPRLGHRPGHGLARAEPEPGGGERGQRVRGRGLSEFRGGVCRCRHRLSRVRRGQRHLSGQMRGCRGQCATRLGPGGAGPDKRAGRARGHALRRWRFQRLGRHCRQLPGRHGYLGGHQPDGGPGGRAVLWPATPTTALAWGRAGRWPPGLAPAGWIPGHWC